MNEHDEQHIDDLMARYGDWFTDSNGKARNTRMPRGNHRLEAETFDAPWRKPLRTWEVQTFPAGPASQFTVHTIRAHYCFNNGPEGLIFRTHEKGNDKTTVTAAFAAGSWSLYKEIP